MEPPPLPPVRRAPASATSARRAAAAFAATLPPPARPAPAATVAPPAPAAPLLGLHIHAPLSFAARVLVLLPNLRAAAAADAPRAPQPPASHVVVGIAEGQQPQMSDKGTEQPRAQKLREHDGHRAYDGELLKIRGVIPK